MQSTYFLLALIVLMNFGVHGQETPAGANKNLGVVKNIISSTLESGTKYDNIINIGCGWAYGTNAGQVNFTLAGPLLIANPGNVYEIINMIEITPKYENRYILSLFNHFNELKKNGDVNLLDVALFGQPSSEGFRQINVLDAIIDSEFGGQLQGNTLVLYEFAPPDMIRLISTLFDRDPALNPLSSDKKNGFGGIDPFPLGVLFFGDSFSQAVAVGDLDIQKAIIERYRNHFSAGTGPAYVDETDTIGEPNTNTLNIVDRFFKSYEDDTIRLQSSKYGSKIDILHFGAENVYEGGDNYAQWDRSVIENPAAAASCGLFSTYLSCNPFDPFTPGASYSHPYGQDLDDYNKIYNAAMVRLVKKLDVNFLNSRDLLAGHLSRFDDPTSDSFVEDDPTYWFSVGDLNAMGQEMITDMIFDMLQTASGTYQRKHSSAFRAAALAAAFPGDYGY